MYCGLTQSPFMQKCHALSYRAADNNCVDAQETLIQPKRPGARVPLAGPYLLLCSLDQQDSGLSSFALEVEPGGRERPCQSDSIQEFTEEGKLPNSFYEATIN